MEWILLILSLYIIYQNRNNMGKSQERFDALMARLDAATNDIATDYQTLLDAVKDTISEESFAAHEANIARLEALGASVDNPVPPVEPPVEPTE